MQLFPPLGKQNTPWIQPNKTATSSLLSKKQTEKYSVLILDEWPQPSRSKHPERFMRFTLYGIENQMQHN